MVANEVKELAKQTTSATEDISQKIQGIQDNTLTRRLPGYESMTLAGNQLHGYGHSVVAGLLTVQGNRLLNGQPSGPTPVGKFFTDRSALSANAASFADEFTPLLVAANELEAAGNLVLVSKV